MRVLGRRQTDHRNIDIKNDDSRDWQLYIVELKGTEYMELVKLSLALRGQYTYNADLNREIEEVDLSLALKAISAFSDVKNSFEQVKIALRELDNKLMANDH